MPCTGRKLKRTSAGLSRADRIDRTDRTDRTDRRDRTDKTNRTNRTTRTDRTRTSRTDRTDRTDSTSRTDRANRISVTDRTGQDRTDRTDSGGTDGSTSAPPEGTSPAGLPRPRDGRIRAKLRPPALPPSDSKEQSSEKNRRPTLIVGAEKNRNYNSAIQPSSKSDNDVITEGNNSVIRRVKLVRASLDDSCRKSKPLLTTNSSDSEYMQMRPKLPLRKREYANIDSCASSCAGGDSSASSGELTDPVDDLQAMLSNLRIRSDKGGRPLQSAGHQRLGKATLSGHKSVRSSKLSRIKAANLLKETMEQNRRERNQRSSERSASPGDENLGNTVSQRSSERGHTSRPHRSKLPSPLEFGYDIDNVSSFLSQATARTPANIPMVVTSRTELYVLSPAASPERPTIDVQLGIVVNALFKRRQWLYVQTPHSQEGYLAYSSCSALGVLPRRTTASPWDWGQTVQPQLPQPPQPTQSPQQLQPPAPLPTAARERSWSPPRSPAAAPDPRPNKTDTEKMYENVTSDGRALGLLVQQHVRQQRGQQRARRGLLSPQTHSSRAASSAFRRLQTAEVAPSRGTLVAPPSGRKVAPRTNNKAVIWDGFVSYGRNTLTVRRGDIVILLNTSVGDWFWVKDADGREGYIPAICVGSGLT